MRAARYPLVRFESLEPTNFQFPSFSRETDGILTHRRRMYRSSTKYKCLTSEGSEDKWCKTEGQNMTKNSNRFDSRPVPGRNRVHDWLPRNMARGGLAVQRQRERRLSKLLFSSQRTN